MEKTHRLAWTAIGVALLAMLGTFIVGWLAYTTSRQSVMDSVAHESLSLGRTIIKNVEYDLKEFGSMSDRQGAVHELAAAWARTEPPYPGSYICLIDSTGRLVLHTENPEMRGTDVSQVIADPRFSKPRSIAQLLSSKESLATQHINFRGKPQIVGYVYMPSIDSLLALHVPAKLVEDSFRNTAVPWGIALAMVGGLLIPLSVGLIHQSYTTAQRDARTATAALRESEQNLRESEARFRTIFEQAAVGVAQLDTVSGTILRVNRKYCSIVGMPAECLVGKTWMELTHPDDLAADIVNMDRMRDGSLHDFAMEKRMQCSDGSFVWINLTVSPMWRLGEPPSTHIAVMEDISERKLVQSQHKESEELFRGLVETAPFGVLRCDFDGRITIANAALGKVYGCDPEQLIGSSIWDFAVDDQARNELHQFVDRSIADPQPTPHTLETKSRRRDGRLIDVNITWTYARDSDGHDTGFIVIVTDITERKESERALEFQADVLNRVSDAVLVTDDDGEITYANEAAERLFYVAKQHYVGRHFSELHDNLLISGSSSEMIRSSLSESGLWQGESEFRFNGEIRSFETKLKSFQTPERGDRFLLSVVSEISSRKKAEQEVRQHRQMLAHVTRLSTMGELVAGIAHEVKQPLYAITNFATATSVALQNVDRARPIDEQWLEELNDWNRGIREASQRASAIIQRLREFARKGDPQRQEIDIHAVIVESVDLVAFEARQCQATVETVFANGLPPVVVDRIQCEQVLVNLLHNAYESFTESDAPSRVIIHTEAIDGFVQIDVEDNGRGIPSDQNGKLFEAFFTTKSGGMGMGLAISRTIIEDHGGRLWATSNEQGGATFHFTLPAEFPGDANSEDD